MRTLFKLILWLLLLSPIALAAAVWFALADTPQVPGHGRLSHQEMLRAQTIIRDIDPRHLPAGITRKIQLSEQDIDLAADYLLQRLAHGAARVLIQPGSLDAVASLKIPRLPVRPYLNIQLQLADHAGQLAVQRLRIGAVPIPALLAELALRNGLGQLYQTREYRLASNLVQGVKLQNNSLEVSYRWDPHLIKRARAVLLSTHDSQALNAYYDHLLQLQNQGVGKQGSLVQLLSPMFAYAQQRSRDADPMAENRALLTVLGIWASRRGLHQLFPEASRQPARFRLKLEQRTDFGQHFLTSAALAARGDAALSDAVGVFKEIADADGGSGFSFTDIAADRAGTRFGELATRSASEARLVQKLLAGGIAEHTIMPPARDLPEHLSAAEFARVYGGVGSAAYNAVMRTIEQRIARCGLYANPQAAN